jgi:hypothetical protein
MFSTVHKSQADDDDGDTVEDEKAYLWLPSYLPPPTTTRHSHT